MIFSEKSIQDILGNKKSQTRRLVKEGEEMEQGFDNNINADFDLVFKWQNKKNGDLLKRNKWCVGSDYAVCPGRGKKCLWYCPKCKKLVRQPQKEKNSELVTHFEPLPYSRCGECKTHLKPLRVVVKSIRKERLLDISEADARKEGYKNKVEFAKAFMELNWRKKPFEFYIDIVVRANWKQKQKQYKAELERLQELNWNPFVWVLEFEVKR